MAGGRGSSRMAKKGVDLVRGLVVAVAAHSGKAQCQALRVVGACLDAVGRYLQDQLRANEEEEVDFQSRCPSGARGQTCRLPRTTGGQLGEKTGLIAPSEPGREKCRASQAIEPTGEETRRACARAERRSGWAPGGEARCGDRALRRPAECLACVPRGGPRPGRRRGSAPARSARPAARSRLHIVCAQATGW